jgi:uncharacterized protein (DUF2225 family)
MIDLKMKCVLSDVYREIEASFYSLLSCPMCTAMRLTTFVACPSGIFTL